MRLTSLCTDMVFVYEKQRWELFRIFHFCLFSTVFKRATPFRIFNLVFIFGRLLYHGTGETLGTFGTISAPKTPKMTLKRRLLDGF